MIFLCSIVFFTNRVSFSSLVYCPVIKEWPSKISPVTVLSLLANIKVRKVKNKGNVQLTFTFGGPLVLYVPDTHVLHNSPLNKKNKTKQNNNLDPQKSSLILFSRMSLWISIV